MALKAGFSIGLSDDLPKRKAPPSKGVEHYQGSKGLGEAMNKITLPGSMSGLLRRGSPVINTGTQLVPFGKEGVVVSKVEAGKGIEVAFDKDESIMSAQSVFALDLEDPTGRAHAIWWLAEKFGDTHKMKTTFEVQPEYAYYPAGAIWDKVPGWYLAWGSWYRSFWAYWPEESKINRIGMEDKEFDIIVPSLSSLNRDDETLLADGSRWVDAEALRRICLHVAGLS